MGQKKGDVLILIDESLSLKDSDSGGARVTAAGYFVDRLAAVAARLSIDLSVSVAGFSEDYHPVLDWTKLDKVGTPKAKAAIETFRDRDQGVQTDYWNGLNGARSSLNERVTASDPQRCQALVWFSDGKFDVGLSSLQWEQNKGARQKAYAPNADLRKPSDAEKAKAAAEKDMCRPGGLADQLRIGRIHLFAIGLTSSSATQSDFATMAKVAVGSGGCGKRKTPPGNFTPASNIDDLLFALDSIGPEPPLHDKRNVCELPNPEQCRKSGHPFVLDNSVTSVHILASSNIAARVYLLYPEGSNRKPQELTPGGRTLQPAGSTYHWITDRTLEVDLVNRNRRALAWTGQWALVFLATPGSPVGQSRVAISISANLFPAWPLQSSTPLRAGDSVDLTFGLVDDRGNAVDSASLLGTGTFKAQLEKPDGSVMVLEPNLDLRQVSRKKVGLRVVNVPVGRAELQLTLELTTAAFGNVRGTKLTTQTANILVEILSPLGTPHLDPLLDFGGPITGAADTTATLGATGPGCVWLVQPAAPDIEANPEGLGPVTITSPNGTANCLRLEARQHSLMSFHLTTGQGGNGTLAGKVRVTVSPLDHPDRATTIQVPFKADLQKPIDRLNFVLTLLAALLLGPGIPLLMLAAVKRVTAKIPGRPLLAREIPVRVEGGQVLREGAPLALRDTDFRDLVPLKNSGSRTAPIPGGTLRTRTGWWPFGSAFVEADTPGRVGLSSTHPRPFGRRKAARLPLAVHNTWLATRDPAAPPDTANVVLLAGLDTTGARRQGLVNDVQARLPGLMAKFGATPAGNATAGDPFASGGGGQVPAANPFTFDGPDASTSVDPFASAWGQPPGSPQPPQSGAAAPGSLADWTRPASTSGPPATPPAQPLDWPPGDSAPPVASPPQPAKPAAPASPLPAASSPPAGQEWSFDSGLDDENRLPP